MNFEEYIINSVKSENSGIFVFRVKPKNGGPVFSFLPGQFAQIKNPLYQSASGRTNEAHLFSIASSPNTRDYLEFCIKVYGFWTQALSKLKVGDSLLIRAPFGKFIWNPSLKNAVFLIAGVGIVPIISMLRFIRETKQTPSLTLIYRNSTQDSITYKEELDNLRRQLITLKIVDVLSRTTQSNSDLNQKHLDLITPELIVKETDLSLKPTFFLCGPPIFIEKMKQTLKNLSIDQSLIHQELF